MPLRFSSADKTAQCHAGADLTLRDRDGLQPLHVAVINKRVGMVDVLLRVGADPNALCANMYPSYPHWKMQRGMRAIQVQQERHGVCGRMPGTLSVSKRWRQTVF